MDESLGAALLLDERPLASTLLLRSQCLCAMTILIVPTIHNFYGTEGCKDGRMDGREGPTPTTLK